MQAQIVAGNILDLIKVSKKLLASTKKFRSLANSYVNGPLGSALVQHLLYVT